MTKLKLWQVDAFASKTLEGNPASVVPLENWLPDDLMQKIARENNQAETAFFVRTAPGAYHLRWFTPSVEVELCGHATLASAHVIFRFLEPSLGQVCFMTRSGELTVTRSGDGNRMSLPSAASEPFAAPAGFPAALAASLEALRPQELHISTKGGAGAKALIAVWNSPAAVKALMPRSDLKDVLMDVEAGSLLATAQGDGMPYDFVSRFFAPYYGVPEDPVTGSAHCALTPFWAKRLGKIQLKARQVSPRGGDLYCTDAGTRTVIAGDCALYLTGEIEIW
ncbi:MAG TPA: PhzF family phenazine biosynthesis protein [Rhizomicrobium sp.]|jgi:PhzF family phenazine biosynthesis protein|nr:PhzF family phenazine biosynthesis protein [Rhizomicrobium sp.]